MDSWIILAVLAGLFSSVFNYVFRYLLKDNGDTSSFSWWFEFTRVLIVLFILPFNFYIKLSYVTFLTLFLIGVVEFLSIYFYSKMHRESQLSISTIVLRLRVVWVPILAFLFMSEKLSYLNYFGILIVFIGLSFVSSPKKFMYDKGIILSFVCSIITAVLTVLTKSVSSQASPAIVVLAMSLPSVFLFPVFVKNWKIRVLDFYTQNKTGILIASLASVIAVGLQTLAFVSGSATQVMGIFQSMSLTTVLAGIFILGEKDKLWQKIIGSVIVIFGAYMLI